MAGGGIPFPSRYALEWRLVLVDPRLLQVATQKLAATGPSHAIEEALKLAVAVEGPLRAGDPAVH